MTLQARTQGLALTVDEALRGVLALGLLEAESVVLGPLPPAFSEERDQITARLTARLSGKSPADIPGVAETRALFHQLDVDPTKTRPSSEALLRRVLQGKGLPVVNAAVDVCNLCSLEDQLPLGLYDRDLVHGAVRVRIGREGEGYPGIRKQRVNLMGRLLLADDDGPFGAPTADSQRTAVTAKSRNLLVVVFCPLERAGSDLTVSLEHIADRLTRYCSASVNAVRVAR
ncbi:MAG TPA: phenylalanine--tRNA ligase beta subunit-related protein [Candidatus Eisenbacteria bacterium]|nr:phenylalanine--tRNA ligase beta subunit-related protein [Candidatus Eisenbacteria bacterium]